MSSSKPRRHRSLEFLNRIRADGPRGSLDDNRIRRFAVNERTRIEHPLNRRLHIQWKTRIQSMRQDFLHHGLSGHAVAVFQSGCEGLMASGWSEIPVAGGFEVGDGSYGVLRLAYKVSEAGVPLESRHLSAVKIQPKDDNVLTGRTIGIIWKEIDILRAVVHENVIDYFAHFVTLTPDTGRMEVWILMEYASAGDMEREIERFPEARIRESGARFYALQVADGLQYLHHKFIAHNDLHGKNVLLKYNPDGSKTCMLADFGESEIAMDGDGMSQWIRADILSFCYLIDVMVKGYDARQEIPISPELHQLLELDRNAADDSSSVPHSVHQFVHTCPWFRGRVRAPVPGRQVSPLLNEATIGAIGYLPPPVPPPGWSLPKRRPRAESAPSRIRTPSILRPRSRSGSSSVARPTILPTIPSQEELSPSRTRSPDLRASAAAAVESELQDVRHGGSSASDQRPSIGHRIGRSFSHLGQAVA